jgi:hypothetical protein
VFGHCCGGRKNENSKQKNVSHWKEEDKNIKK